MDTLSEARHWNVSDECWSRLSPAHRALYAVVRPQQQAAYEVDVALSQLENFLGTTEKDVVAAGGVFDLEPDYQRGHVWNDEQRSRYAEAITRGSAPGRILFNCPGWTSYSGEGGIPSQTFQCIDGLQRLTALRRYMRGEITVFDGLRASDLHASPFDPRRVRVKIAIYEFRARVSLLQFYLDLNAGGTVHAPEELARVRLLLDEAKSAEAARAHHPH